MASIPPFQAKKTRVLGLPYHGKVKGGQVVLDLDQATKTYPQIGASNLLLEAVGIVPYRVGNALDAAESYEWRDRLLLQIGDASKPAGVIASHFVYLDPSARAWLIAVSVTTVGVGYRVTLTLLKRWGLITDQPHTEYNRVIFTSLDIDLSAHTSSLGLSGITGQEFVSQNPRGDEVLIGVGGNYGSPVNLSGLASIPKIQITGSINPDTGIGAQATMTEWKSAPQLIEEPTIDRLDAPLKMKKHKSDWSVTCTGVPGTGTATATQTLQDFGVVPDDSDPLGFYYQDDPEYLAEIQKVAIYAFYNEDGDPALVETETTDKLSLDENFAWTETITYECQYDVTASIPLPHWNRTSAESLRTVDFTYTATQGNEQSIRLLIDGIEKESLVLLETGTSVATYADSQADMHISCFNTGQRECTDSSGTIYSKPYAPTPSNTTVTSHFTVKNNGTTIYNSAEDQLFYGSLNIVPGLRQLSNRVFGLVIHSLVADHIGTGRWFGAHTDTDGKQGEVKEFAAYNPYDQTVDDDDQYFGFV